MRHKRKKNIGAVGLIGIFGGLAIAGGVGWLIYSTMFKKKEPAPAPASGGGSGLNVEGKDIVAGGKVALDVGTSLWNSLFPDRPTGDDPCKYSTHFADLRKEFEGSSDSTKKKAFDVLSAARRNAAARCTAKGVWNPGELACYEKLRDAAFDEDAGEIKKIAASSTCASAGLSGGLGLANWWRV